MSAKSGQERPRVSQERILHKTMKLNDLYQFAPRDPRAQKCPLITHAYARTHTHVHAYARYRMACSTLSSLLAICLLIRTYVGRRVGRCWPLLAEALSTVLSRRFFSLADFRVRNFPGRDFPSSPSAHPRRRAGDRANGSAPRNDRNGPRNDERSAGTTRESGAASGRSQDLNYEASHESADIGKSYLPANQVGRHRRQGAPCVRVRRARC